MIRDLGFLKLQVTSSVRSALELINGFNAYRLIIIYSVNTFRGLFTEGDLRRSLLNGCKLADDLPNLINEIRADSFKINTYTFDNQWIDIGRPEDLKLAKEQIL